MRLLPRSVTMASPSLSKDTRARQRQPGGGDDLAAVGSDLEDPVVGRVGDPHVAGGVDADPGRGEEPRGNGRLGPGHADLDDPVVAEVGDVDVPGRVERHAVGLVETGPDRRLGPPQGVISTTWLLPVSATKTSPVASRATSSGWADPLPRVTWLPAVVSSTTRLLPVSATKTSPAGSLATPSGVDRDVKGRVFSPSRRQLDDAVVEGVGDDRGLGRRRRGRDRQGQPGRGGADRRSERRSRHHRRSGGQQPDKRDRAEDP